MAGTTTTVKQVPAIVDMEFVVDDDMTWSLFFEEETTPDVFAPITLTGNNPQAMIKKRETDEAELDHWDLTPDSPSAGWLILTLDEERTKALGKGEFWYSVRLTRNGYTRTYVAGKITLGRRSTYD